jgi:large subunit ribosomal protein L22
MIRGMKIEEAMNALEFSKRRSAWYFKAVLRSALASAQEEDVDVHGLYVSESRVDEGPTTKRWQPKDRGRAHPIAKRTSHLYVSLDER